MFVRVCLHIFVDKVVDKATWEALNPIRLYSAFGGYVMAKEYCTRKRNGKEEIYARYVYRDEQGNRKQVWRPAESIAHAKSIYPQLVAQYQNHGSKIFESERMSFKDLATYYEESYLTEPQYVEGRKVSGLRSHQSQKLHLKTLREYFGTRKLKDITRGDVERFKSKRLATPTKHGGQRAIASVNRELALLRRMLHVAQGEGWIIKNPFGAGRSIISTADEKKRERIISREEEDRLLAFCTGVRAHLKPIVIMALDTGMRVGEILKLTWDDVDFSERVIHVQAFNTKTMQERFLAMTRRIERELSVLYEKNQEGLVFGITDNIKKAFMSARRLAGLDDVRFHDLRHTAATRLVRGGRPLQLVGRTLGHTKAETTYRYVNNDLEDARASANVLEGVRREETIESVN